MHNTNLPDYESLIVNRSLIKSPYSDFFTEEVSVNEDGGKESKTVCRFDLLPPMALFVVSNVLKEGADKYGEDENWRQIPISSHLNHALNHIFGWLAGDETEDHLSHALCRLLFACELYYLNKRQR